MSREKNGKKRPPNPSSGQGEASIHPTAIIGDQVTVGAGVKVGPYAVVEGSVTLGDGVVLHGHAHVSGRTSLGAGVQVFPFACLGGPPEDLKYRGEDTELHVGADTHIREFVVVRRATAHGGGRTVIGERCLLMAQCHVNHDCVIGDDCIITTMAALAGHVRVGAGARIGGMAGIHQFARIGEGAMVGGLSRVTRDVPPFALVHLPAATVRGANLVGLRRGSATKDDTAALKAAYGILQDPDLYLEDKTARIEKRYGSVEAVQTLLAFLSEESILGLMPFDPGH